MSSLGIFGAYGAMLLSQLPVAIASLIGIGLVMTRWKTRSRGLIWALAGFGLSFLLSLASPLSQVFIMQMMSHSGGAMERGNLMTISALFFSVLRALTYALLALAIYVGHASPTRSTTSRGP